MAESKTTAAGSGWSLAALLTIVFIILKATHVISWSWWWVFSPLIIDAGLTILAVLLFGFIGLIVLVIAIVLGHRENKR